MSELDRLGRKIAALKRNVTSTDLVKILDIINDIYEVLKQQEMINDLRSNEP